MRNEIARCIVAGFSTATPNLAVFWDFLDTALRDIESLTAEVDALRLDRANLLAAMRATVGANADGEPDPLAYLRDELDARATGVQPPEVSA